jgi:transposase-like protein
LLGTKTKRRRLAPAARGGIPVPTRIPASERTSQNLEELLTQGVADGDARAELLKLAVRKIVEEALEAEVAEAVGRGYYENGAEPGAGYRNGYRRGRLRTAEGPIEYGVPQVADRAEPFVSRVRARLAGRTAELERLAVEMFARGLSTRDIEAAFQDATGASLLSRTAVSQVTERLWQEYEAFAGRDLSEFAVAYFFVDGVAERLHAGMPREAVLCAWGITEEGQKVLLHLAPGTKEDTASCTAFFQDLKRRGLADPLLVVTDGAAGLIRAAETCFPRAVRQRCLVHRLRNLRSKAPDSRWLEIAIRARACYESASPALATLLRDDFVQAYERELPALVKCFLEDFDACIAHLRFPLRHRKVIRTTNLLERLFLEERRRTKIIPHAFGERPVLKLMYAAIIRAADRWRGITVGEFEQRQLQALRDELNHAHAQRVAPAVRATPTSPVRKLRVGR